MKNFRAKSKIKRDELNPLFHFKDKSEDDKVLTPEIVKRVQKTGKLELSGKNLKFVPEKVYNIQDSGDEVNSNVFEFNRKQNEDDLWWNKNTLKYLDLSSNVITEISGSIKNLLDLTTLNIQDNALTTLPTEIGQLEKLTHINLSHNKINQLPSEFFRLRELKYLNLSFNELIDINLELTDLVYLELLDLSNNKIDALPAGIGFLTRLTELILHHNHLQILPNDITNLRNLKKLDLTNNDLKLLPEYMSDLRKIEFIYAQHNDIDKLPNLEGCDQLQELHISNNFITEIPENFCEKLPNLKVLDLRDNKIEKLPDEISMLQNLMRLDLSNNSISSLPTSLCTLAHLVSLKVDGNPIKSIRRDVIACGTHRILKTLRDRTRDQGNGIGVRAHFVTAPTIQESPLPDKYQLKKTRSLTVCNKDLTDILPEQLFIDAVEADISIVDFTKNKLKELPEGLTHLSSKISELNLSSNQISTIQPFVSQFSHIKYLNLSCNHLEDLPDEIGLLVTIREINFANNRLKVFPKCIYSLVNCEIVLACDNKIEEFDASVESGLGALKRLASLDLSNNNLNHVPPVLGNMTHITNLALHGNCFKSPRVQILEKGTASVLSYLRDRIPKDF